MRNEILSANEIENTIRILCVRIRERFPGSSLSLACEDLLELSGETNQTITWIARPNYAIRAAVSFIILLLVVVAVHSVSQVKIMTEGINIAEFIQMIDAAIEGVVFISAGVIFLVTFENRRKRNRIIKSINKLICIAHIIDAHQLTKDPDSISDRHVPTPHSPSRCFSAYELGRYLDYCSEMLSLVSKLGFLYTQNFADPEASEAANDLENLTTGLSRKIWQKIMIIRSMEAR